MGTWGGIKLCMMSSHRWYSRHMGGGGARHKRVDQFLWRLVDPSRPHVYVE